jgi:mono/diheme cytochrome c family protein
VADVGQDAVEEVNIVERGDNLGWDLREGFDCTSRDADCETEGLKEPVWVYRHELGASITGGYVYEGDAVPALRGHYLCADFLSGRLFAVPDPASGDPIQAVSLGQWPLLPSTFGQDAAGEIYVADFAGGILYGLRGGDSFETPAASPEASDETQAEAPEADGAPMPTGDAAAGEAVYKASCIACHQADGTSMGGVLGADFVNDKTRLAKSDAELYKSVTEGVPGTTMVAWTALSVQQRVDAVAYIRATYGP